MSALFERAMRQAPQLFLGGAILVYIVQVTTAIAAGEQAKAMTAEALPVSVKLQAATIIFVLPLVSSLALFFCAALLWRLDRITARNLNESHA